jgi:hypothetical protein
MNQDVTTELHALRLAVDVLACHVALVVAPTSSIEQIRATILQLYWDLRPLVAHSPHVDHALDAIAHADCEEEDTLDLEQFGRRLIELRGAIALLPGFGNG